MLNTTKYITSVPFSGLINWSVQYLNYSKIAFNKKYPMMRIGEFLTRNKTAVIIEDNNIYKRVTIKVRNGGVFLRDEMMGKSIGTKKQFLISKGQFLLSKIDARNGAFGVVPDILNGSIITGNFWAFDVNNDIVNPHYLTLLTTTSAFISFCEQASNGTTNRHYLQEPLFLNIKVPIPSLEEQNKLVEEYRNVMTFIKFEEMKVVDLDVKSTVAIRENLGLVPYLGQIEKQKIYTVPFHEVDSWSVSQLLHVKNSPFGQSKYNCKKLSDIALINPKTDLSMLKDSDEMSFIPMEDISDDYGEWQNNRTGLRSQTKGYKKFQDGDIIWARITPCMQNGKSALLNGLVNGKGYGSTEFHIVRLISNEVLPQYIHTLLRHSNVLMNAKKYFTGSAGQQRVPETYLTNLLIPIPPKEVQTQIANEYADAIKAIQQGYAKIYNYKQQINIEFETQIFE